MWRIPIGRAVAGLAVLLCIGFYAFSAQNEPVAPISAQKSTPVVPPKPVTSPPSPSKTPRLIAVDLLVAEVASRKGEGTKPAPAEKQLDARDLSGPIDEVLAKVETLKKTGQIGYFRRIQLSAAEGQPASVSIGESRPVVTGVGFSSGGHVSRNISYAPTGTNVRVTPRITADGQVLIDDLNVDDTRGHVPEDGVTIGTDEKSQPIRAEERITAKLTTRLSVASGQARAAQVVTTSSKSGQVQTFVIVGARIVEP